MIKSKAWKRDWREALRKVNQEGQCRVCKSQVNLQAAHTISRRLQDVEVEGPRGGTMLLVKADAIVPLCYKHHFEFDARRLDLLPYLFLHEQVYAVETAGGIMSALKRLSGPNG